MISSNGPRLKDTKYQSGQIYKDSILLTLSVATGKFEKGVMSDQPKARSGDWSISGILRFAPETQNLSSMLRDCHIDD